MMKQLLIYLLIATTLPLFGQAVVSETFDLISVQDSLFSFKTTTIRAVSGSLQDTFITYSTPIDSTTAIEAVYGSALSRNEERAGYFRQGYNFQDAEEEFTDFAPLLSKVTSSTLKDLTADRLQDFFTGSWQVDNGTLLDTFTVAYESNLLKLKDGGTSWTIDVYSSSEVVIKAYNSEDLQLIRIDDEEFPTFRTVGLAFPILGSTATELTITKISNE